MNMCVCVCIHKQRNMKISTETDGITTGYICIYVSTVVKNNKK